MKDISVTVLNDNPLKQFEVKELYILLDMDFLSEELDLSEMLVSSDVIDAMGLYASEEDAADVANEGDLIIKVEVKSVQRLSTQSRYTLKPVK